MMTVTSRALWLTTMLALIAVGCTSDDDPSSDGGNTPGDGDGDGDGDGGGDGDGDSDAGDMMVTAEECFEDLQAPDVGFVEIQRFESDDGAVRIWRARQPGERSAVGETFPYDLKRAWIESEDEPGTCVTAASALSYEFGHHNWLDTWTVTTEHAVYVGQEMYVNSAPDPADFGWVDTLEVKDASGEPLFMVGLVDDGCETKPYDLNACRLRMRLDMPPPGWGDE